MKIILDAMGGDNAPQAAVAGAYLAAEKYGCEVVLVGDTEKVTPLMKNNPAVTLVHASEVIENEEKATAAVRGKKDSSMSKALSMLANGEGDAVISAGSTGALLTGATLIVKRVKGVRRGALGTLLPTKTGSCLLCDVGANSECTAEYLLQFAYLGSIYMEKVAGIKNPRVALLNNGTEEGKGAPLQKESFELIKSAENLNFVGNIEGRDIFSGDADVIVCDGFSGNIALKTMEGTAKMVMRELKSALTASALSSIRALLAKPKLNSLKDKLDYKKIGGAPFLGISKPVIKAHGSSDENAFCAAVFQAIKFAQSGYTEAVCEKISEMTVKKD